MRILSFFVVLLLSAGTAHSQNAKLKRFTTPLAGKVVLKDVDDKYNAYVYSKEMPKPDADAEQAKLQEIKRYIAEKYPHRKGPQQKKTSSVAAPIVGINFVADTLPGIPPDNSSAVSAGYKAVSVMNSSISVHDAYSGAYLYGKGLKPFSSVVGLMHPFNDYRFDPKVLYDQENDRFICIMLNSASSAVNWIVIGFTQTNDPAGTWNFYKFFGNFANDSTWFDYPAFAVTKDELFFTGNQIRNNMSWQAGFKRTVIYQVRKADGYAGAATLNYQIWDSVQYDGRNLRCLHPVVAADSLLRPSQYFLSNRNFDVTNDTVFLVKVPDTIGSTDTILTVTPVVSSTISYGVPPDARQPDTSLSLATNDGRVLGGIIKGDQIQFVSVTVNTATGNSALYHGIISGATTTSPALSAQLYGIDSLDLGYPNLSYAGNVAGANHAIISFEFSGPTTHPGFGAILFDGTNYSNMTVIRKGDSTIRQLSQKQQRWGDYSGSQQDWVVGGAVWALGIYGRKDRKYGDYIAQLLSPYHAGTPVSKNRPESKLYPNPAKEYISFDFNVREEQGFSFYVYDMQGRLVDKVTDNFCHAGENTLQFNIASLPPGTYVLKGTGVKGEVIPSKIFVHK
ncbi:MAG: hypothetical protein K0Q79_1028 [Flavipsychrobacter sp.]|jgi:hypothetical protein|nr:hypothetical protein [Flavipsychrobacter sp.]